MIKKKTDCDNIKGSANANEQRTQGAARRSRSPTIAPVGIAHLLGPGNDFKWNKSEMKELWLWLIEVSSLAVCWEC